MIRWMRLAAAIAGLTLGGPHGWTQGAEAPPESEAPTTLSARSTLVVVPALVRDKEKGGELVFGLKAEDFVLTDDGVPQKLHLEADTGGEPLALVIVVEGGGAAARQLGRFGPVAPMLESVVGAVPHRMAVVAFDSKPELFQDFTPEIGPIASAMSDLITGDSGDNGAAIFDALGFAVDLLRKQPLAYRRAILLLSESVDRGSTMKLDEALRAISDTNTAIYSIGFSTGRSEAKHYYRKQAPAQIGGLDEPNPPHGCMGKDPNADPRDAQSRGSQAYDCMAQLLPPVALAKMAAIAASNGLRKNIPETVAQLTGGEYFKLTSAKGLEQSLQTISNHIPNRYVLSFQPQDPHPGLHALRLTLPGYNKLAIESRISYWADAPGQR